MNSTTARISTASVIGACGSWIALVSSAIPGPARSQVSLILPRQEELIPEPLLQSSQTIPPHR